MLGLPIETIEDKIKCAYIFHFVDSNASILYRELIPNGLFLNPAKFRNNKIIFMKDSKPKLKLKRRTIANLSNIEMRSVYGGGGDDEDISMKACDQKDDDITGGSNGDISEDLKKKILLLFPTRLFC